MINTDGDPTIAHYPANNPGKPWLSAYEGHVMAPVKPMFAVDWDGTCVEDAWPLMGAWLPGAIDALRQMTEIGHVTIWTCRIIPLQATPPHFPRPMADTKAEIDGIRKMLDNAGLRDVSIWTHPFKPAAQEYIDNKARRYLGRKRSWETLVEILKGLYA